MLADPPSEEYPVMNFIKKFLGLNHTKDHTPPSLDVESVVHSVQQTEETKDIPLGYKIHSCTYRNLELRFDRDITLNGRICIFEGKERLYSFTVYAKKGEYDTLREAYETVIEFLNGDQSIKNLPDNEVVKGFLHHN